MGRYIPLPIRLGGLGEHFTPGPNSRSIDTTNIIVLRYSITAPVWHGFICNLLRDISCHSQLFQNVQAPVTHMN